MSQGACDSPGTRPDAAAASDASPDAMPDAGIPVDADLYDSGGEPIYSAAPTFDGSKTSPEEQRIDPMSHDSADLRHT